MGTQVLAMTSLQGELGRPLAAQHFCKMVHFYCSCHVSDSSGAAKCTCVLIPREGPQGTSLLSEFMLSGLIVCTRLKLDSFNDPFLD